MRYSLITIFALMGLGCGNIEFDMGKGVSIDDTAETGSATSPFDRDGDGFDAAEDGGEDCDDGNPDVNPDGFEIWFVGNEEYNYCADGIDNDCNGLADDDDWACQNGDADQETPYRGKWIANGVDMAWGADSDGDGLTDTLYVRADEVMMPSPWNAANAVMIGDAWGEAFDAIDLTTDEDGDGMPDNEVGLVNFPGDASIGRPDITAWEINLTAYGLSPDEYHFTLVSVLAADEESTAPETCVSRAAGTTWKLVDKRFCEVTGDPWCLDWRDGTDGCGNDLTKVFGFVLSTDGSIAPIDY